MTIVTITMRMMMIMMMKAVDGKDGLRAAGSNFANVT